MRRIKTIFLTLAVALLTSAVWLTRSNATVDKADAPNDVVINFDTSLVTERVWYGTSSGGASGQVTIEALNNPPQILRGTWVGRTRWQVVAGGNSFVAEMNGKINTYNGVMMMRGKVVNGANLAAEVFAQGQVVAINPHRFTGTIRVIQP